MNGMFNGMFGKIANGMCRLSYSGGIAVKTSNGYKSYNVKTGKITNCTNFAFDIGNDFFFVIPTNKVEKGDIILVKKSNGEMQPKCVISVGKDSIKVINYETNVVEDILPERHVFMGNTYFYGKIVSMFGNNFAKGKEGMSKMMTYMMMSEMLKGNNNGYGSNNGMNSMLPFMLMGGGNGFADMFEGMFDFDVDMDSDETDDEKEEE